MTITNYTSFLFLCCYHIRMYLISRNYSFWGIKLFKYFCVVQINGLRFKFWLNGIYNVSGLVLKFLNLTDLSLILVGKKACLFDEKTSLSSLLKDKLSKGFGDPILLSLISCISRSDIVNIDSSFWDFKRNVSRIFTKIFNDSSFILGMFICCIRQDG